MTEMTKEELEYEKEFGDYIEHHGIIGQKWGKTNGPPYPLKESLSKVISKVGNDLKEGGATAYAKAKAAKAIADEKIKIAKEKKAEEDAEKKAKKEAEEAEKKAKKEAAEAEKKAKKEAAEAEKKAIENDIKTRDEREAEIQKQIDNPRRLSDDELNKLVSRLEKEKRLGELTASSINPQSQKQQQNEKMSKRLLKKIGDSLVDAASTVIKSAATTAGSLFVAKLVGGGDFDKDIFAETMKANVAKSLKNNNDNNKNNNKNNSNSNAQAKRYKVHGKPNKLN